MRTIIKSAVFAMIAVVVLSMPAFAKNDYPLPTETFFVNDFAGVLDQDTRDKIANLGKLLEEKTGAQVVVVTISTLDGQDIESYSNELFNKWGIGQKGKDNGILILDAVSERMLRIEVGYGLEGAVPDIKTAEIREKYMNPYLKNNDYNSGLYNGYAAVVREVAREYGVDIDTDVKAAPKNNVMPFSTGRRRTNFTPLLVILFLAFDGIFFRFRITLMLIRLLFWSSFFRGGGRGGWGGPGRGGFGGGSWGGGSSGGGGRSGGGGSSGGY